MSDNIPFEMQVEVMKRLPVKSLAVFRSVSKAWKSMIDNPLFISDYSNLHQHHRLLIRYIDDTDSSFESEFKYLFIVDNDDTLSQHNNVSNVSVSFEPLKKLELVGMSRGLLCLFGCIVKDNSFKKIALIWNPSLRKSITIEVPRQQKIRADVIMGFGVRPDNCDPMIVMINYVEHRYQFMLFALSARVWRVLQGNLPSKSIVFSKLFQATTDNRCIYWKAYESERSIYLVVAFDMVCEDFTEINLPHSVAHRSSPDFSIFKVKESLALLEYYDDPKKGVCGVWMMVEDGVSKSFTKLFTINTPDALLFIDVLGFRKNVQPIMETAIDGVSSSLEVYDPRTGTIKNLGINGKRDSFFCCSYTETLILLDQLDEQFVKVQLQL